VRLIVLSAILIFAAILNAPADANTDPISLKQEAALLTKRVDLEKHIETAQRQLHQLELSRKDKLEELAELYRAYAALDKKLPISKDVENEISAQKRNLGIIEEHRSDCLEELDALFYSLTQMNRDLADYRRAVN
jgi:chromosome segregation ATPase